MGQQQLLLLVFGVIIVGVAVIAGIQAVSEGYRQSEADNMVSRNLEIANAAIAWRVRMHPYKGTNTSYLTVQAGGMNGLSMSSATTFANSGLGAATAQTIEITSVSIKNPNLGVRTYVSNYNVDSTTVRFDGSITLP